MDLKSKIFNNKMPGKISGIRLSIVFALLFFGQFALAQCPIADFTVTPVNGICVQDGQIDIEIPGASGCTGVTATLNEPGGPVLQSINIGGSGTGTFVNLLPGNYEVRLKQGATTTPAKTATVATSYKDFTVKITTYDLSCKAGDQNYSDDGEIKVEITNASQVSGLFEYKIPALGLSSGPIAATTYTFTGLPAGIHDVVVTNTIGTTCVVSKNYNGNEVKDKVGNTIPNPFPKNSFIEFVSVDDCDSWNIQVVRDANGGFQGGVRPGGYATITYNGNTYNAVSGKAPGYTPPLGAGFYFKNVPENTEVTIEISDGCNATIFTYITSKKQENLEFGILHKSSYYGDICSTLNYIHLPSPSSIYVTGTNEIVQNHINYHPEPGGNGITWNLYIEEPTGSSNYILLESRDSDTGPETFPDIDDPGNALYSLINGRNYRIELVDNKCGSPTITKDFTFNVNESVHPLNNTNFIPTTSMLEGTVGFSLSNAPNLKGTLDGVKWTIDRTDGMTSYTYPSESTYTMGAHYAGHTINFPYEQTFYYDFDIVSQRFIDLPPGEYIITAEDLTCGVIRTQTVVLDNPIQRFADYSIEAACNFDPSIHIEYSQTDDFALWLRGNVLLFNDNGNFPPTQADYTGKQYSVGAGGKKAISDNIDNVASGDYYLRFGAFGDTSASFYHSVVEPNGGRNSHLNISVPGAFGGYGADVLQRYFFIPVHVDADQGINFHLSSFFCDSNDPYSGALGISVTGYPVDFITYEVWEDGLDPDVDTPTYTYTTSDLSETSHIFNGLTEQNYTVRVSHSCGYIQQEVLVTNEEQDDPEVFGGDTYCDDDTEPMILSFNLSETLYDIEWYDEDNNLLGEGASITVTPIQTTTYRIDYTMKAETGCADAGITNSFYHEVEVVSCSNIVIATADINQIPQGDTATGNVLDNDYGDGLTVTGATYLDASGNEVPLPLGVPTQIYDSNGELAGTMTLNADGTYTFVSDPAYTGEVPITYEITDADGNTDTAVLSIEVVPAVNPSSNNPPVAQNDTAFTPEGTPVSSTVLGNDSDPDGDNLTVTGATSTDDNGNPITIPVDGTPTPVYGTDEDGNPVLAGTIELNADGTYTFTPEPGFTGTVNPITYTIDDGNGGTDTAILFIEVLPEDGENSTFANDDANTAPKGETMTGNVLDNDTDPEGNGQEVTDAVVTLPDGTTVPLTIGFEEDIPGIGKITLNSDGTYTFIPDPDFVGTIVVGITVCDNEPAPDTACDTSNLYLTTLDTMNCYKPANLIANGGLPTEIGISALRLDNTDDWPQVREGAWIALEAKTKGFVPNRLNNAQIAAIPSNNLVSGMMVYNTDEDCLQINVDGTSTGWKCFNVQSCD